MLYKVLVKIMLLSVLTMFIILTSCKKKNGGELTLTEELAPFEEIILYDVFDVFLTQDSTYSIKIIANEKIVEKIDVSIENNILSIRNDATWRWLNPKTNKVKLYISVNRPKKVTAKQPCNIMTTNPIISDDFGLVLESKLNTATLDLNCNVFYYWNNFPTGGNLTLTGKSNTLKIWNTALMTVDASNLTTGYALVENDSKGICKVRPINTLEYSIHGEGDVYLFGEPTQIIVNEITSTGELVRLP